MRLGVVSTEALDSVARELGIQEFLRLGRGQQIPAGKSKVLADAVEALDGTSVENEKLVDDYRAWRAQSTPQPPAPPADHP